jgi:farnesyl diphosphate synthase
MLPAETTTNNRMSFEELTGVWRARIEDKLDRVLPPADTDPATLHAAMRYSVLGGGKRIRPVLVYATGHALGVPMQTLDVPAAAIELMHAFSLVHDDLPAMDDDKLRRGRPTTHIEFDEATAILAADAMQPLAFRVLATDPDMKCSQEARLAIIDLLAEACGSTGMTGGQAIDLAAEGKSLSAPQLENMYRLKTGLLLRTSVLAAAICGDADANVHASLARFIENIGLAFQIRDDILDVEGDTETIGKQQGADIGRNKATWPALFGMDEAKTKADDLLNEALAEIENLGPDAEALRQIARYIVNREM